MPDNGVKWQVVITSMVPDLQSKIPDIHFLGHPYITFLELLLTSYFTYLHAPFA